MPNDWKQRVYEVGSKVAVFSPDKTPLGVGELQTRYDADGEDNEHPRILMPDGKIILGCECWWIPVAETEV